jgi:hypothetical protein
MKKSVVLLASLAVLVTLSIAVPLGLVQAGGNSRSTDTYANAQFQAIDPATGDQLMVWVHASESKYQSPPGGGGGPSTWLNVQIDRYDPIGNPISNAWGGGTPSSFSVNKHLTAGEAAGSVVLTEYDWLTGNPIGTLDVDVDLDWDGTGALVRSHSNSHSHSISPKAINNSHHASTWRPASATGSVVMSGSLDLAAGGSLWAELGTHKSKYVFVD